MRQSQFTETQIVSILKEAVGEKRGSPISKALVKGQQDSPRTPL